MLRRMGLQILVAVALVLGASPARAQEVQFANVGYSGVYEGLVPGGVVIRTPVADAILPRGLSFTIGGNRVDLGSLAPETPVWVNVPGAPGQVVGGYGNMVFVQYPTGVVMVPGDAMGEAGGRAKVTVLKPNGKTVRVPLNAALNMQRSQGAVIVGSAPLGGWPTGWAGPAVMFGNQGDHVLVETVVGGVPRLVRVPRSQAGSLVSAEPGNVVEVSRQGAGLGWGLWNSAGQGRGEDAMPGHGHGNPAAGSQGGNGKGHGNQGKGHH